jgi:hypothetical protein
VERGGSDVVRHKHPTSGRRDGAATEFTTPRCDVSEGNADRHVHAIVP